MARRCPGVSRASSRARAATQRAIALLTSVTGGSPRGRRREPTGGRCRCRGPGSWRSCSVLLRRRRSEPKLDDHERTTIGSWGSSTADVAVQARSPSRNDRTGALQRVVRCDLGRGRPPYPSRPQTRGTRLLPLVRGRMRQPSRGRTADGQHYPAAPAVCPPDRAASGDSSKGSDVERRPSGRGREGSSVACSLQHGEQSPRRSASSVRRARIAT